MAKKLLVIDDQTGITKVVEMIARQLGLNARTLNSSSAGDRGLHRFQAGHADARHDHAGEGRHRRAERDPADRAFR